MSIMQSKVFSFTESPQEKRYKYQITTEMFVYQVYETDGTGNETDGTDGTILMLEIQITMSDYILL